MIKSVFISGASGNLGRAVSAKFLNQGYQVTAVVGPRDDVNFISNKNLFVDTVDLSIETDAINSLKNIIDRYGPFSFAVFTVGGFNMGGFPGTGIGDIQKMIQLNFETAYTSARVFFKHFKEKNTRGRMILIGARPGLNPYQASEMVAYGLSKSLIFGLADIINASGKDHGIDAAVIVPSIINTPANRKAMPDADFSDWVKPDHLAENIYFLSTVAGRELKSKVFKVYGNS